MYLFKRLYAILIIVPFILASCSDSDDNPAGTNGNNYTATFTFTADGESKSYNFGGASYDADSDETIIVGSVSESVFSGAFNFLSGEAIMLDFDGGTTGTYQINSDNELGFFSNGNYFEAVSGSINISSYGDIGGKISGSFSVVLESSTSNETMEIKNGEFSVTRFEDDDFEVPDDSGDDDDDNNNNLGENSFYLSGGNYNNTEIDLNRDLFGAGYFTNVGGQGGVTVAVNGYADVNGTEEYISITSQFYVSEGHTGNVSTVVAFTIKIGTGLTIFTQTPELNITKFSDVNGLIELEFSGTFKDLVSNTDYTITNGKLSVKRMS